MAYSFIPSKNINPPNADNRVNPISFSNALKFTNVCNTPLIIRPARRKNDRHIIVFFMFMCFILRNNRLTFLGNDTNRFLYYIEPL